MVLKHPLWLAAGIIGGATFGAVFPVWGLVLAKTQNLFYKIYDTDQMRSEASMVAIYFVILAIVAFVSSGLQFWYVDVSKG